MMNEPSSAPIQMFVLMMMLMIVIPILSRLFEGAGYFEELDRRYDRRPDRPREPNSDNDHRNDAHPSERQKQYRVNQYGEIFEETDD